MSVIPWSDEYSVGIEAIDEQHRCLIAHLNKLHTALELHKEPALVSDTIHMLLEYIKIHFAVEETLMRFFHYDAYIDHKLIHASTLQRLLDYQEEYLAGDEKVATEMFLFLEDWLFDHITTADRGYAQARLESVRHDTSLA